ncbi:MFS transporter [Streptomyces sp. KR80]|uniref:MFS transporter n=1 Tax=Streptomyces sp. KR80 TaxID=3457426 RepID=UPI003FD5A0A8
MGGTTVVKGGEPATAPAQAPPPDLDLDDDAGPGAAGAAQAAELRPRRVRTLFFALMLTLLPAAFDQTIVVTALPEIVGELPGLDRTSWAATSYLLAFTIGLPLYGKLGDLFGRKGVVQFALLVFVIGSALAGRSRTMDELIAFRAVQGIGGGGLLIGVQTIVADLVPPRARGRYLGLIGAVFGLAPVAGPLFGGFLTDHASWRWCFYPNVPIGLVTMVVVALVLDLPKPAVKRRFDVLGALLLAASTACLVLLATWGGTEHAWTSRVIAGLACGALGTALLFVVVEHCVPEPIVPPRLFRDPVFTVTGLIGAVLGAALLGAAGQLPTFLQLVHGVGATESGLLMLPMMGGIVLASIATGHLIARTGRYRAYPVLGCAVSAVGMWLLSRLDADTPRWDYSWWMAVLGVGIGLVMPVLILAVQNSVAPSDLGAATGAGTCLRQLGGSVGAAVFGTLIAHRLADGHPKELPSGTGAGSDGGADVAAAVGLPGLDTITPQLVRAMDAALGDRYVHAYADVLPRLFLYLVPVLLLGLLLAFLLKEKPLVSHNEPGAGDSPIIPPARSAPAGERGADRAGVPVCGTVRHHDGSAVPRAALTLIDVTGRQIGRGASGEDGRYALSTPDSGAFVLVAAAAGHQPRALSVTVGERPVELDVVLGGAGRLVGTVTTADGTPVRDATVTLTDVWGEVVATTRSGREGGYVMAELVAGEYVLAAGAPAFRPAALPVTVQASCETRQDVELAGGAVLRGTVRCHDGRPVGDARVTLLDAAGNVVDTLTTGVDGTFRFVDLSAGEYTLIAAGYPPVATVLQVARGGRTERDLQLGHKD